MDLELYRRFFEIEDRFWWSVGTRRIFFQLIERLRPAVGGRVLDVGCGTGVMLQQFPRDWQLVTGCDASEVALSFCRERGVRTLVRCDATQLPFASDAFDLVTALDVVEHLERDDACLREIARVCRPGKHVLIHVPAFQILWSDKDLLNHHYRRYRRSELVALVTGCGLTVTQSFYVNSMLFPVALVSAVAGRVRRHRQPDRPAPCTDQLDSLYRIPAALNRVMIGYMALERRLTRRFPVPFGMSLVCVAQKDEHAEPA